jgi:signal peptidase I
MDFQLATWLTIATLLCGFIWGVDAAVFRPRRRAAATADGNEAVAEGGEIGEKTREPILVEYARSFFPVFLIVLLIRSFLFEPFHIPSASMVPTLLVGDFILVNKFDYGLRLPVSHTKILGVGEPQRGDVAVFRFPRNPKIDYIKRIVGLPGDHIVYRNEQLYINGKAVPKKPLGLYSGPTIGAARLSVEHLGKITHDILNLPGFAGPEGEWTVPPHDYFAMGDNRDDSSDSRVWGFVPEKNLVGKAVIIWFNWQFPDATPIWSRIGDEIK